ncbi:hypothetical protein PPL_04278 [Heterostelium album PN500]|uniref:Ankyrin repeat protein n=1 Tax=Heterostelium pallidum (strain ATCC 26659 / Pp 5 / PN500) TaxID=670386 RepID=D3B744_HETP5|nr:hypothetical protein PPL_04278 [Heterostelium album PN500]EFA82587.1 hypothetical protein PPL_04278 [Heterostelium album PN500]|eukprot:XP_020434704.1 hypothetical protein PPL_04278 [Heterostelium album PN500]
MPCQIQSETTGFDIFKWLLDNRDHENNNVILDVDYLIDLANQNGNLEALKYMFEKNNFLYSGDEMNLKDLAIVEGDIQMFRYLVERDGLSDEYCLCLAHQMLSPYLPLRKSISSAIKNEHLDVLTYLCRYATTKTSEPRDYIKSAVKYNSMEALIWIHENVPNCGTVTFISLCQAIENRNFSMVKWIIEHLSEVDFVSINENNNINFDKFVF